MEDQYFIRLGGREQGPFTAARLQSLARRGKFSRLFQVSVDRHNWERASAYPELFPAPRPPKMRRTQMAESQEDDALALADPADTQPGETPPEEEEARPEADEPQEWFYTYQGHERGPVSMSQLQWLASAGQLSADEYLWKDGMPDWILAEKVPEVFQDGEPNEIASDRYAAKARDSADAPIHVAPMAVASFVLGLLGASLLFFLGSILAVVFGHVALKQIATSGNTLGGRGMAIAGLILGYVVLITSVVVGIVVVCIIVLGGFMAASSI